MAAAGHRHEHVDVTQRESKMSVRTMARLFELRMSGQNPTSVQESLGVFGEPADEDEKGSVAGGKLPTREDHTGETVAEPVIAKLEGGTPYASVHFEVPLMESEELPEGDSAATAPGSRAEPPSSIDIEQVFEDDDIDDDDDDPLFGHNVELYRSEDYSFLHTLNDPVEIIPEEDAGHGEDLFVPVASRTSSRVLQILSKIVRKPGSPELGHHRSTGAPHDASSTLNSTPKQRVPVSPGLRPRKTNTSRSPGTRSGRLLQSPSDGDTVALPPTPVEAGHSGMRQTPSSSRRVLISSLDELEHLGLLGRGMQGSVYLARHKPSKFLLAVKVEQAKKGVRKALRREIRIQCGLSHRNVVRFYGSFYNEEENRLHTLTQYMDGGSMYGAIQKLGRIPEAVLSQLIGNCLAGLKYMHELNIMHRDIKTQNVLLSLTEMCTKLTDFGHSKYLKNPSASFVGTIEYMSPERLEGKPYTYAADIWSLGLCVVEGYIGRHPFESRPAYWNYVESATKGDLLFAQYHVDGTIELNDFVSACTHQTPYMRPTAEKLLSHPWIRRHRGNKGELTEWFGKLTEAMSTKV